MSYHHHSFEYDQPRDSPVDSSNRNYNNPLINTTIPPNIIDDEEIARQQQENLYGESLMDVDEPTCESVSSTDADAAYAYELQQQEYSRNSITPVQFRNQGRNNEKFPSIILDSDNGLIVSDAELAAHIQAEENQKQKGRARSAVPSQRRPTHPLANGAAYFNEFEVIPNPPFARPTNNRNNNLNHPDAASLFRLFTSRAGPFHGSHRSGGRAANNLENTTADFGPDDYEHLLELDNTVKDKPLHKDQINRLPTEKFRPTASKNDEENKCSICMDDFERNQTLRRLTCLHLYHKECIDNWLKTKNLCPICRIPPIE